MAKKESVGAMVIVAIFGCSSAPVIPFDVGGSMSDGVVIMVANATRAEDVNWDEATGAALKRCQAWGFRAVEPFTGYTRRFVEEGFWLDVYEFERKYQCLDPDRQSK